MNLKKKYFRKRKDWEDPNKSGTSASAVKKAEKTLKPYAFLSWLQKYTQFRQGRNNLPSRKSNSPSAEEGKKA